MFFWLWEEDALFKHRDKQNAKVNKEHKTGWIITTCLLPITPVTLEAMGPMNVQRGANKRNKYSLTELSERGIEA